jgi:DNA-binding protein HU-beta
VAHSAALIDELNKEEWMAKMTQTQIIAKMAEKSGLSKKQVKEFITDFVELAYSEAKKGEFSVPGLGKLVKQKRKARLGRNPATGEAIKIPAKTVVKARIAKQLKDAVLPRAPAASNSLKRGR